VLRFIQKYYCQTAFLRSIMDIETAYYIIHHFPRLLTLTEVAALNHSNYMFKLQKPEDYRSPEAYEEKLKWFKERNLITEDPGALNLLNHGREQFYINAANRIIEEASDKVFFNFCSKCGKLARTPYARQCKWCQHNWHHTIAANFKVNKVFDLTGRATTLYFAGDIKSGDIKSGMKIDLTFLGVSIKPVINAIEFVDHIAGKNAEVALSVIIETEEDRVYLKKGGVLAIPIIIEY